MSRRAYLDYAATAPFDTRLADTMAAASWANANALYTEGRAAASQLEDARKRIAVALGAHAPSELTFTSGGSESDNTAIRGLAKPVPGVKSTHVVVSSIEHDAVLNSAKALKSEGFAVDKVDPDVSGIVRPEALEALLARIEDEGGAVTLVAVQAVNNELGTIQPVRALARVAHAHRARFFTDAVQGLGKLDIDLEQSGVDAAAFSAHKIGALKGVGALYLRRGIRIKPLVYGGGQEAGMRSGTQNVMGALVFAQAVENAVAERTAVWERASAFRAKALDALAAGDFAHQVRPTLSCDVAACDGPLTEQGDLPRTCSRCSSTGLRARRSSCAPTTRASPSRRALPARRARSTRATCCSPSGFPASSPSAACACRSGRSRPKTTSTCSSRSFPRC